MKHKNNKNQNLKWILLFLITCGAISYNKVANHNIPATTNKDIETKKLEVAYKKQKHDIIRDAVYMQALETYTNQDSIANFINNNTELKHETIDYKKAEQQLNQMKKDSIVRDSLSRIPKHKQFDKNWTDARVNFYKKRLNDLTR